MHIGVFDHLDRGAADLDSFFEDRLRLIECYDAAGVYAYHLAEHHGTPLGMAPSPSVFLAAVAQRTRRLRFGPMVYCLPMYNPLRLLEEICMLDQLSGGRLELGVGRGISPVEAGFYGLDPSETPAMYQEALDFVLQGLAGGDFSFEGTFYRVSDIPMILHPVQRPHPPLWYGTANPEAATWTASNAINIISNQPPDTVRAITDRYRATWATSGHSHKALPMMGLSCHVVVAETEHEALESARRGYRAWRSSFMYLWDRAGRAPVTVSYPEAFDDLAAIGLGVAGTPEQVTEAIERLAGQAGINYFVCRLAFGDLSFDESARSLALLADRVMPELGAVTVAG
ncbi:MAG TPA: LLM class flavin-dependent oxidoreductase [Alphaproteobacteria bacterium]|nr:LLM class flavin-dependent oxidoreductase [Alphaproteobacteria bacterium]